MRGAVPERAASRPRAAAAARRARRFAQGVAELGGEVGCARPGGRLERESRVDRRDQAPREVAPLGRQRGRAGVDRARDLLDRHAPERVAVGEDLPEEDADRPDVALGRRVATFEPLGSDVRERSRNVSDRGQRVGPVELREAEVEEADGDASRSSTRTFAGFTSRWTIPARCAWASASSTWAAISTASSSVSSPAPIVSRSVRPGRTGRRCRRGSGRGRRRRPARSDRGGAAARRGPRARRELPPAFAQDDLERDVQPVPLVEGEPDRARPTRAEGPHGSIAAEDEVLGSWDGSDGGHRLTFLAAAAPTPRPAAKPSRGKWHPARSGLRSCQRQGFPRGRVRGSGSALP